MELTLESESTDEIKITFEEEDDTLLNLLKQSLLDREEVDTANYVRGHPTLDAPTLNVTVLEGEPVEVIEEAAADARDRLKSFADRVDEQAG